MNAQEKKQEKMRKFLEGYQEQTEKKPQAQELNPVQESSLMQQISDEELKDALRAKQNERRGRPRKENIGKETDDKFYMRTSLIISRTLMDKIREISFRETLTIKDIVNGALGVAVKKYEDKHGELIPKNHYKSAEDLFL